MQLPIFFQMCPKSEFSDSEITMDNLVMDNVRQSQSQDCDPSPPIMPRLTGSKSNLFDGVGHESSPHRPKTSMYTPSPFQQAGIIEPKQLLRNGRNSSSNPSTPITPPRKSAPPNSGQYRQCVQSSPVRKSTPATPHSPETACVRNNPIHNVPPPNGYGYSDYLPASVHSTQVSSITPNRKYASESELLSQQAHHPSYPSRVYNQTADNIRSLAYAQPDGGNTSYHRPYSTQPSNNDSYSHSPPSSPPSAYNSASQHLYDGPEQRAPGSRRPVSFVKALEMSDSIDMVAPSRTAYPESPKRFGPPTQSPPPPPPHNYSQLPSHPSQQQYYHHAPDAETDRNSSYEMNYEISV